METTKISYTEQRANSQKSAFVKAEVENALLVLELLSTA